MDEEERRALLRSLSDDQYQDVMNVCAALPNIEMTIKSEGMCSVSRSMRWKHFVAFIKMWFIDQLPVYTYIFMLKFEP